MPACASLRPMRKSAAPHTGHVPRVAARPPWVYTGSGFCSARLARQRMQYASNCVESPSAIPTYNTSLRPIPSRRRTRSRTSCSRSQGQMSRASSVSTTIMLSRPMVAISRRPPITIEVLRQLGVLSNDQVKALAAYHTAPVKNGRGAAVGEVKTCFTLKGERQHKREVH